MAEYVKVAELKDVPPGSMYIVEFDGEPLVLANVNDQVFAFGGACTHRGGPLGEGELSGNIVTCPWHGGQFDISNGQVVGPPPATSVPSYQVQVEGIDIRVARS